MVVFNPKHATNVVAVVVYVASAGSMTTNVAYEQHLPCSVMNCHKQATVGAGGVATRRHQKVARRDKFACVRAARASSVRHVDAAVR